MEKNFIIENNQLVKYMGKESVVVIPEGVKNIDYNVFCYNKYVNEIIIPDSIEFIDEKNFCECPNLKFNVVDGIKYLGNKDNPYLVLVSSDEVSNCKVVDGCKIIMGKAFSDLETLASIMIPSSVKYIGFMAFYGCNNLKELELNEGLIKIDDCVFELCNFNKIKLPNSLEYLGRDSFCISGLTDVTLPNNLKYLGSCAFTENEHKYNQYNNGYYFGSENNPYLCLVKVIDKECTNFVMHQDCKFVYSNAFLKLRNLKEVKLSDKVVQIGYSAFRECMSLEKVYIPETVEFFDEECFASCDKLKEITFPTSKITIDSGAFMGCNSLKEITLKNAIVGDNAFDGCSSLEKIIIGDGCNLYGDYIFSDCPSLREVILPEKLKNRYEEDEFEESENVIIIYK